MNPFSIDGYDGHSGKTHRAEANGGRRSVGNMKDGLVRRPVNQLGHALRQVKKVPRCRSGATAGGDPPAPAVVASVDEKSKIGNPGARPDRAGIADEAGSRREDEMGLTISEF
jgi:hypothetical protein